jgi:hypothetical protein
MADGSDALRQGLLSRRGFLAGAAATAFLAACGRNARPKALSSAQRLTFNTAHVELAKGDDRLAFALFHAEKPVDFTRDAAGTLTIRAPSGKRTGPIKLRTFGISRSAGGEDAKTDPEKPSLVFVAHHIFDEDGYWDVVVDVSMNGERVRVPGRVGVPPKSQTIGVGEKAVSTPTPTTSDARGVKPICTRVPQCTMHAESLDDVLGNGKPTVVTFATPALCESRMCGPDVDIVEAVDLRRKSEANFVHVEIYKDSSGVKLAPAVEAWNVDKAGEPWVFFVGSDGKVRERLSGPIAEWEVDEAVGRLSRS